MASCPVQMRNESQIGQACTKVAGASQLIFLRRWPWPEQERPLKVTMAAMPSATQAMHPGGHEKPRWELTPGEANTFCGLAPRWAEGELKRGTLDGGAEHPGWALRPIKGKGGVSQALAVLF